MNVWLKWLDCCFIVDDAELMQEVPGIYCLLVVEGLAEIQGDPLSRIDDALDTIPTHLANSLPPPPLTPLRTHHLCYRC